MTAERPSGQGEQLVLPWPARIAYGTQDLLVTPANEDAIRAVAAWPHWLSPVMVLVGPPGSGKSHLAAIWAGTACATRVPPDDLNHADIAALATTTPLLIEDMPHPHLDERALFHLINLMHEQRSHLLLTSQSYPVRWPVRLADLASRLKAAALAELGAPDDVLLRAVLVKLFHDRQLVVDEALIGYLTARMERSLGFARHLVEEIDRRALAGKAKITRPFVARVLADVGRSDEDEPQ